MASIGIIGCGPAGMLAAYAVDRQGLDPIIMSKKRQSIINPVQCLQYSIPDIPVDGMSVFYGKQGSREDYARKVYGDPEAPTSWDAIVQGEKLVWPLNEVYNWLWDRYNDAIDDNELYASDINSVCNSFPLVISSAPAPEFCQVPEHIFHQVGVKIHEQEFDGPTKEFPSVIMNGKPKDEWYRFSAMRGRMIWEYPMDAALPGTGTGIKPISTTCHCHPRLQRIGRFGKWSRGVQNHHPFRDTVGLMGAVGISRG